MPQKRPKLSRFQEIKIKLCSKSPSSEDCSESSYSDQEIQDERFRIQESYEWRCSRPKTQKSQKLKFNEAKDKNKKKKVRSS